MNWFRRLCLFVFGVCGILSLAALSLVWVGPWTTQARTLITENKWYFLALEVMVCVSGIGLLFCVLKALFTPRNPKESIVIILDGGQITITRHAIVSQVKHIVEADGACSAASVHVRARKRGNIRVNVRLRPHSPVDVVEYGQLLHKELEQGLAKVCGDSVRSIDLVFLNPEQRGEISAYVDEKTADAARETVPEEAPAGSFTVKLEGRDVSMHPSAEQSFPLAPSSVKQNKEAEQSKEVEQSANAVATEDEGTPSSDAPSAEEV